MKKLLHIGCGPQDITATTPEFNNGKWVETRVDIDPNVNPDIIGSMTDISRIQSSSYDAVFSSHNIEHLYPHEVPVALAEFHRVLNHDGFLVITCPDLRSVCNLVVEDKLTEPAYISQAGPITPIDIIYGHRGFIQNGNFHMAHKCGFTKSVLVSTLHQSGFATVCALERPTNFDLWAVASKSEMSEPLIVSLSNLHLPSSISIEVV